MYLTQIVTIPNGLIRIGQQAFKGCTALTSITIPDSVTQIYANAFEGCSSLTTITIPDGVIKISDNAFNGCTSLTSINIPDGVIKISGNAFNGCTSLTSINIPDSVTQINSSAFYGCTSLTKIYCNKPDLFTDENINNKDLILFISIGDYLRHNYLELLIHLNPEKQDLNISFKEFNPDLVSFKELNLIMRLQNEDYLPDRNTILTTFKNRSIYQIDIILNYFGKTQCRPKYFSNVTLITNDNTSFHSNHISMFLKPHDHSKLSMTAKMLF